MSPDQITTLPTLLVAVITAISVPIASVIVALISRRGNQRTSKSDRVPDVINVIERQLADIKTERDHWRDLAWRQLTAAETDTEKAFDDTKFPPPE